MSEVINVAIDGPAGAGKSTIAKNLAGMLGYTYIDTGAMYRALALFFIKNGLELKNEQQIIASLGDISVGIKYSDGVQHIFLNGEDVSEEIRKEEVGNAASITSAYPKVREKLLSLQRELASENNCIMDGRDIGSFVLPEAKVKVYLTADVHVRAKRRFDELLTKGEKPDLKKIEEDIRKRDEQDKNRATAPLVQAEDAVLLDSSGLSIEEVTEKIRGLIMEALQ